MYWTLQNWTQNIGEVHTEDCGYCEGAPVSFGATGHDAKWLGPFERFADAVRASNLPTRACDQCSPGEH
jgi:hypothetical protein